MTYEQYQQILETASAQIAQELERFDILEGQNVDVFGNNVGVSQPEEAEEEPAVDTWRLFIFGRVRATTKTGEDPPDIGLWSGWESAVVMLRSGMMSILDGFWQQTQLVSLPPDPETGFEGFSRSIEVEFQSRGVETEQLQQFPNVDDLLANTYFRLPVRMVVGEYVQSQTAIAPDFNSLLRTYNFDIQRQGDGRSIQSAGTETILWPISVTRLT